MLKLKQNKYFRYYKRMWIS